LSTFLTVPGGLYLLKMLWEYLLSHFGTGG
jgi:hypothetical protein